MKKFTAFVVIFSLCGYLQKHVAINLGFLTVFFDVLS